MTMSTREYEDEIAMPPSTLLPLLDDPIPTSKMLLDCCRKFLSPKPRHYEFDKPTIQINTELYLFCEAGSQSVVYVAKIENGRCHDKVLKPKYSLIICKSDKRNRSPPWHLVFSSSSSNNLCAVSRGQDGVHIYSLTEGSPKHVPLTKPASDPFSIVLQVGGEIVAVTDDLHVFYRDRSRPTWVTCCHHADDSLTLYKEEVLNKDGRMQRARETSLSKKKYKEYGNYSTTKRGGLVLTEKSYLTGYAVVGDNSFIVSDANSNSILVYDLWDKYWSVLGVGSSPGTELLNGRSVLVHGFIYSCTNGGVAAHELVWHDDDQDEGDDDPIPKQVVLRNPIMLEFSWELPWRKSWEAERMCLDCVSADRDTIVFCVVQGEYRSFRRGSNDVHITTVEVKTRTPPPGRGGGGKREPERIEHVAIGTCFLEHDEDFVWTRSCFALETT